MKRVAIALVLTLVALAASSSFAQSRSLRFDAPFAFSADGRDYAAGSYELRTIGSGTFEIRQLYNINTGKSGLIVLKSPDAHAAQMGPAAKLVFKSNGDRAWLASLDDYGTSWKVPMPDKDRERLGKSGFKEIIILASK
jgi:hypothetical protein